MAIETSATDVGGGGVTIKFKQKSEGARETMTIARPTKEGAPLSPFQLVYNFGPSTGEGSYEALRTSSLRDLWAYLIAHSADRTDPNAVAKYQSELKAKLFAALPLWDDINATATLHDITMQTAGITAATKTLSQSVAISGLNSQGSLAFDIKFDDLGINSALLPAWAEPLIPTACDLDMKISVAGLDKVANVAISDFDMGATPPWPAASNAKIAAVLAKGEPKLTIAASHLASSSLDLSFQGDIALTAPKPAGRFKITAGGLDKALEIVRKAGETDVRLQQAVLAVSMFKGLAKPDTDGRLTWDIEIGADGTVVVNGMAMPKIK